MMLYSPLSPCKADEANPSLPTSHEPAGQTELTGYLESGGLNVFCSHWSIALPAELPLLLSALGSQPKSEHPDWGSAWKGPEALGLGSGWAGRASSSSAAEVCADWWVVKSFEYHPGEQLKNFFSVQCSRQSLPIDNCW